MTALRISVSVLCVLLLSGADAQADAHRGSHRAKADAQADAQADAHRGSYRAKADAAAMLIDKINFSFTAANVSLTNLVNIGKMLTHSHNQNSLRNGLEVFDGVAKVIPFINLFGSLVHFGFAFLSKNSPDIAYMKKRFTQVSRDLNSISAQVKPLSGGELWPSEGEALILNAWARVEQLVDRLATAETLEEKSRAAERFTTYYESRGTEDGIAGFCRHLTESRPAGRCGSPAGGGGSLMQLVGAQSEGDVRALLRFSSYVTSLMIKGSFASVIYDKLKSDHANPRPQQPATERLLSLTKSVQRTLMDCADGYAEWVRRDVEELMTHPFSETRSMATNVKAHLDGKFDWFIWTVVVQETSGDYGYLYGNVITLRDRAQGRTVHLIPRDSEAVVDEGVRAEARQKMLDYTGYACPMIQEKMTDVFPSSLMRHIAFAHSSPDSSHYTTVGDTVVQKCYSTFLFITTSTYVNTVVLNSMESLDHPSCSKSQCLYGACRQAADSSAGFCLCETMYYGRRCENSIRDEISDSALEEKIKSVGINSVPDITAVYFRVQEQMRHAEARERFHWVTLRYQDMTDKLAFLGHQDTLFRRAQVSGVTFVSNVGGVIQTQGTFTFLLYQFDNMMRGNGSNLLEALRELLLYPGDSSAQTHSPIECSETYAEKLDNFVESMSRLKSEAISAWKKYLTQSNTTSIDPSLSNVQDLLVGDGCGPLNAHGLINNHCEGPYHSAHQQRIRLKCSGSFKPFPETVQCSKGRWSALPVCYGEPENGATQCRSENGTAVCEASCDDDSARLASGESVERYQCSRSPCRPFTPSGPCKVASCSGDSSCEDREVCKGGRCVDGCSGTPCGVNAVCSTFHHVPVCTCFGPWTKDPNQECLSPSLHWAQVTHIPNGRSIVSYVQGLFFSCWQIYLL